MQMNATEAVRNYAAANGTIRKKDVKAALDLTVDQVVHAVDTLKRQGYLIQIRHGLYQFVDAVEKPGADINDKIWRAMKISPTFTAEDIAKLADSSRAYVYKRFRAYRADGYIKQHGVERKSLTSWQKIWRLTQKGKGKACQPNVEVFEPDPLIMAAVNLNRLICSGVAVRDEESGRQALALVEQIRKGLEDVAAS